MSTHVNRVHAGKAMKKDTKSGAFPCDYCEATFQSSRSRSMHVRNQHAAAQLARLAEESSVKTSVDSQPRHWDSETVQQFVRAMFVVGTGSNVEIARHMKSKKTAHNVKGFKLKFLKEHPNWRTEFRNLNPSVVPPSDSEEEETETITVEIVIVEETDDTNIITPPEEPTIVEMEATVETGDTSEKEGTVETETLAEKVIVETETPVEKQVVVETTTPAEEEPTDTKEATVGTEETPTTPTTVAAEEPPTIVETEPTVPHAHEATGESLPVITIAYPLQNSLDCPHCPTTFPGDRLEDLRKHLQDDHSDRNIFERRSSVQYV